MAKDRTDRTPKKGQPRWQDTFLKNLASCGNALQAAKATGIGRQTAYDRRERDLDFRKLWEKALDESGDALETEAWRRAVQGTERPVFYLGKQVGSVREYSDVLLIFLLKGIRPEKYRENFDVKKLVDELRAARTSTMEPAAGTTGSNRGNGRAG